MNLIEIELRIKILDAILQEARANGDDRWHEPARQIDELQAQRAELLKSTGQVPDPITIQAKPAVMGAKGTQ